MDWLQVMNTMIAAGGVAAVFFRTARGKSTDSGTDVQRLHEAL